MSVHCNILLLLTLWASLQDGLGLPVMLEVDAAENIQNHQVRTKRCACSNQLDSECHYFCHLDIIWVNTPSKTTVYGLGVASTRHRRSTDRCTCSTSDDPRCSSFCQLRPVISSVKKHLLHKHSPPCCYQVKESMGCICG